MEYPLIIIFPYISSHNEFIIGEFNFLPLSLSREQHFNDSLIWEGILKTLKIFKKHKDESITDGLGVIIKSAEQIDKFNTALLSLKYSLLSNSSPYNNWQDEHFHCIYQSITPSMSDGITLVEGHHKSISSSDYITRRLPGHLNPQLLYSLDTNILRDINHLYNLMLLNTNLYIKNSINWYCRGQRWNSDVYDKLISVIQSLEIFARIGEASRKSDALAEKIMILVVNEPNLMRWVKTVYRVRNKILHTGYIDPSQLIYTDNSSFQIDYHTKIANVIFTEIIVSLYKPNLVTSDKSIEIIVNIMKTNRIMRHLSSNKQKLELIISLINKSILTRNDNMKILDLFVQFDSQDFSLTLEDCSFYLKSLVRIVDDYVNFAKKLGMTEESFQRTIRNLINTIIYFRTNLNSKTFNLP